MSTGEKTEECAAAEWLSEGIEFLADESGLSLTNTHKLKKITKALATEVFSKNETCMRVENDADRNFLEALCEDTNQNIISSPKQGRASPTPLVLDFEKEDPNKLTLYFRRQFLEETFIAERMKEMAKVPGESGCSNDVGESGSPTPLNDEQKKAVKHILQNKLSLISGGPGTGKTTLLFRALFCFLLKNSESKIVLAAPTGKAAARIGESIFSQKTELESPSLNVEERAMLERLSMLRPVTIHKMLGIGKDDKKNRNEKSPIDADLIAIDEASMISQDLMAKILHAFPEKAKLILLGDSNQLESVEPGRVFADLCTAEKIEKAYVRLEKSYRFNEEKFLGQLASAVLGGNSKEANRLLNSGGEEDVNIILDDKQFEKEFNKTVEEIFPLSIWGANTKCDEKALLDAIESARILSPVRKGKFSVEWINEKLRKKFSPESNGGNNTLYHGVPILITQNDNSSGLNNGDVGVVLKNSTNGIFEAYFRNPEDPQKGILRIPISSLPEYEIAYATTVHKAQGSEFSHLVVFLPGGKGTEKICTRELLYTALTRYKEKNGSSLALFINPETFEKCVNTPANKHSLLRNRLDS